MKSKYRKIVILAIAALGLAAVIIFLMKTPEDKRDGSEKDENTAGDTVKIQLVRTYDDINEIMISLSAEEESFVIKKSAGSTKDKGTDWNVEELSGIPVNDNLIRNITKILSGLEGEAIETEDAVASELMKDASHIVIKYNDGSETELEAGAASPSGGSYVQIRGEQDLYLTKSLSGVCITKSQLVDLSLAVRINEDEYIETLRIDGSRTDREVMLVYEPNDLAMLYNMTSPVDARANDQTVETLETQISTLTADSAERIFPDEQELERYGLKIPGTCLTLGISDGTQYRICAGISTDGYTYVMKDEVPVIFKIPDDRISLWNSSSWSVFRSPLLCLVPLNMVEKIDISAENTRISFEIDQSDSKKLIVTADNAEINTEEFRNFYQELIGITLLEDADNAETGPVFMEYIYKLKDGETIDVIIYEDAESDRRYIAQINGVIHGKINASQITYLMDDALECARKKK